MQEKNGNGRTFRFRGLSLSDREQTPKYSVVKREKIPQKRLNSPAEFAPGRLPVKPGKRNNEIFKREFPQKKRDSPGEACFPIGCRTKRENSGEGVPILRVEGTADSYSIRELVSNVRAYTRSRPPHALARSLQKAEQREVSKRKHTAIEAIHPRRGLFPGRLPDESGKRR